MAKKKQSLLQRLKAREGNIRKAAGLKARPKTVAEGKRVVKKADKIAKKFARKAKRH